MSHIRNIIKRCDTKMVLQFLSVFIVILYSFYYFSTRTFNYWKSKNVPGPKPIPFFGNLKESALRRRSIGMVVKQYYDSYPNEKVVGIYRMTSPTLLIRDPEIIKHIMIKDFDLFVDRGLRLSNKGLGMNLFLADEETWKALRNKFTPLFTTGKLKNMLYLMTERGDKFVEYVNTVINKQPEQNVFKLVQHFTIATIAACAFGLELNVEDQLQKLQEVDKRIFSVNYGIELEFLIPGVLNIFGSSIFPRSLTRFFKELVESVIAQRNGKPSNRKDFMDLILELREAGSVQKSKKQTDEKAFELEMTDDVIAAQAFVFYAAGYETSATTMGFFLYQIALNPRVQDKLVAEINEVLEKHKGNLTYEAIADMKYMDRVFDETLRMYPPLDLLQRCAKTDYKIPGTNITIEKGQIVVVSITGLHYEEKYFDNPDKFEPERFSVENSKTIKACTYLPFGIGPRNCIGMRFAQTQSRICLIYFLKNFKVEATKNTPTHLIYDPYRSVLAPLSGLHLKVSPRK